jgi:GNAT superfamily N-acetyltransferase
MTIRTATPEDLGRVEKCAREFYSSSRHLKRFDLETFRKTWLSLFASDCGVIFLVCDDSDDILGALGAVAYPDPNSGELVAVEFFWFIRKGCRGKGLELYRRFEQWARDRNCLQIRMGYLVDLMAEKHQRVYRRLGFEPIEVTYAKTL